jgi:hypothetical protein
LNKSKFNKVIPLSLLIVPLLLVLPAASAATPPQVKGYGTFTATVTSATTLSSFGGYTLYRFSGPDVLTGTETGTGWFALSLFVFPSGHDVGSGTVTCTSCTVSGVTGNFIIKFASEGTYGGSGHGTGQASGSGGLKGFHGVVTYSFVTTETGFTGPYQLEYTLG